MPEFAAAVGRAVIGRPVRGGLLGRVPVPKRIALPVFASDALSSVAYAPDQILLTLSLAGTAALAFSPWIGIGIAVVMTAVVASYRLTVRQYPSGGGDYEVASANLGSRAGVLVGSATLVDYALTVAVSVSCGAQYLGSLQPWVRGHQAPVAMAIVAVLALLIARGLRGTGRLRAISVYAFMSAVGLTAIVGFAQSAAGRLPAAATSVYAIMPADGFSAGLTGLGGVFLVFRAFSAGSVALTGVETIATSVPSFRRPSARNAAATLAVLGAVAIALLLLVLFLAQRAGVHYVADPAAQLRDPIGLPLPDDYVQIPVIAQLADLVFRSTPAVSVTVVLLTAFILCLAATASFGAAPALAYRLARDSFLPKQLYRRGDRRITSHGIVALAIAAAALIWVFDADVTRLIQLYVVGVFGSMALSQAGMIRHWNSALRLSSTPVERRKILASRALSAVGFGLTALALGIVLATKFLHGAWVTAALIGLGYGAMRAVAHHYARVSGELDRPAAAEGGRSLPARVHAIILVSRMHRPALRAIAYARGTRPSTLEVLTVGIEDAETDALRGEWEALGIPAPLKILASPTKEITRPIYDYIRSVRRGSPRELVVVYIPEYVVRHWWERALHNHSAARLTRALRRIPGVVIASVPWQLGVDGADGVDVAGGPVAPGGAAGSAGTRPAASAVPAEAVAPAGTAPAGTAPAGLGGPVAPGGAAGTEAGA